MVSVCGQWANTHGSQWDSRQSILDTCPQGSPGFILELGLRLPGVLPGIWRSPEIASRIIQPSLGRLLQAPDLPTGHAHS